MPNFRDIESSLWTEVAIRVVLMWIIGQMECLEPFARVLQPEELWQYKYPLMTTYLPKSAFRFFIVATPLTTIGIWFVLEKDWTDLVQAVLCCSLALLVNGILTRMLKLTVGRPRPSYFWRCFPDGQLTPDLSCTGNPGFVRDGRMSFPSAHSSFAFASLGFVAFYLAGKMHVFGLSGRGRSGRLLLFLLPLVLATLFALSRTCDYMHHWQDVLCGSVLGLTLTYVTYCHYYPSLSSRQSHRPYAALTTEEQE